MKISAVHWQCTGGTERRKSIMVKMNVTVINAKTEMGKKFSLRQESSQGAAVFLGKHSTTALTCLLLLIW